jgi:hypothetical protein
MTPLLDVSLLSGFGREDAFIEPLLGAGYRGRLPDAAGIAARQRGVLDWAYVRRQLTPLVEMKDQPEILTMLDGLQASG